MKYFTQVIEEESRKKFEQTVNRVMNAQQGMIAGAGVSRVKGEKSLYYCVFIAAEMTEEEKLQQVMPEGTPTEEEWEAMSESEQKEIIDTIMQNMADGEKI